MSIALLIILSILWVLGFLSVDFFNYVLFSINQHAITVLDAVIFVIVLWVIGVLPHPFREIAAVLFVLWILSLLGFLVVVGLSQLIIVAIILGIIVSLFI